MVDVKTEFVTSQLAGNKARSITEEIISYAQLRLAEMTKNSFIEFFLRANPRAIFDKIGQEGGNQTTTFLTDDEFRSMEDSLQ